MSGLGPIVRKEVKEILTPSVIAGSVAVALFFGLLGNTIVGMGKEITKPAAVGIIDEDNGPLSDLVVEVFQQHANVVFLASGGDVLRGVEEVERRDGSALLIIPRGFSLRIYENRPGEIEIKWVLRGAGTMDMASTGAVYALIQIAAGRISEELVRENSPVDPAVVVSPLTASSTTILKGREIEGASPEDVSRALSTHLFLVPLILMMVIMSAGSAVISSMGLEKENKTLETLLTLPIKRRSIVAGKIAGGAIAGFLMASIYMAGLVYYMRSVESFGPASGVDLASAGLTLEPLDYILFALSLLSGVLVGLSLCMLLGCFARDYRSAQMLVTPVALLVVVPMILLGLKDFSTLPPLLKAVLFAIPFSHPAMAMSALIFDDYSLVLAGIAYMLAFALLLVVLLARIFRSERLLAGGEGRLPSLRFLRKRGS